MTSLVPRYSSSSLSCLKIFHLREPPGLVEKTEEEKKLDSDSKAPTRSDSSSASSSKKPPQATSNAFDRLEWPSSLQWVPDNFTWAKLKPTIRSAISAWLSTVLFLIPVVERFLGQASFLILITSFMSPPNDSFMGVLEREFMILAFVTTAWAWSCLGIKLADLARVNRNPSATFLDAVTGQYLEVAPTVIFGVFIFVGSAVILYIELDRFLARFFACILGLSLSGYYAYKRRPCFLTHFTRKTGQAIVLPTAFHSAIAILCSIFIFPSSVSAQFTTRLALVLGPLAKSLNFIKRFWRKILIPPSSLFDGYHSHVTGGKVGSKPGSARGPLSVSLEAI
ncbi:hypothetical protein B0H14DRAFT_25146 [Mycena olivaceomarginata]|nr:hypothetical protein B0H14DRAFT_25146 [Mycena olivaceomarginata]